jgi:hypothetical protein
VYILVMEEDVLEMAVNEFPLAFSKLHVPCRLLVCYGRSCMSSICIHLNYESDEHRSMLITSQQDL